MIVRCPECGMLVAMAQPQLSAGRHRQAGATAARKVRMLAARLQGSLFNQVETRQTKNTGKEGAQTGEEVGAPHAAQPAAEAAAGAPQKSGMSRRSANPARLFSRSRTSRKEGRAIGSSRVQSSTRSVAGQGLGEHTACVCEQHTAQQRGRGSGGRRRTPRRGSNACEMRSNSCLGHTGRRYQQRTDPTPQQQRTQAGNLCPARPRAVHAAPAAQRTQRAPDRPR